MNDASLEAPRFVDDPLEETRDRVGPERPFGRDTPHVRDHLLLALGLVHLDAEVFLEAPDLARHARALVEQPHQHFVHAVDVVAQIVHPAHRYTRAGRPAAFNQRTYSSTRGISSGDPLSFAMTDTSALPTTAASAKPPISATCSGRETPKPSASGSDVCARMRRAIASAPDATRSRAPVTPSREMPYRKPLPSSAARRILSSVVVGLRRKIVSMPLAASAPRKSPASSIGRSSASTPSTPAAAACRANSAMPTRRSGFA